MTAQEFRDANCTTGTGFHRHFLVEGPSHRNLGASDIKGSSYGKAIAFNDGPCNPCADDCSFVVHERMATETMLQGRSSSYQPAPETRIDLTASANHFDATIPLGVTPPKPLPATVN